MKLYYHPLSTYSQKAMLAFYEKQVAFEPTLVNLMTPEGVKAYEAIYPLGKIPLLKLKGDYSIPESTIIIEYLDGHYPQQGTRLIPDGVDTARQVRFMDRMGDLYVNDPSATLLFHQFGFSPCSDSDLSKARKHLHVAFQHLEQRLAKQEWLCGAFSMADCATIPALFYCQIVASFKDYRNIVSYYERAKQRPSYARVMNEFVPIWEGMQAQHAGH